MFSILRPDNKIKKKISGKSKGIRLADIESNQTPEYFTNFMLLMEQVLLLLLL